MKDALLLHRQAPHRSLVWFLLREYSSCCSTGAEFFETQGAVLHARLLSLLRLLWIDSFELESCATWLSDCTQNLREKRCARENILDFGRVGTRNLVERGCASRIFWSSRYVEFKGKEGTLEYFGRVGT